MKLSKNKKGSQLVEKILMVAFAVAGGGAVIVYGSNVLTNAKNTEITGILGNSGGGVVATSSNGTQLIAGKKYRLEMNPVLNPSELQREDMEYFSCSRIFDSNGTEITSTYKTKTVSRNGFVGYTFWNTDENSKTFFLEDPATAGAGVYFGCSVEMANELYSEQSWFSTWSWQYSNEYPTLNDMGMDDSWRTTWSFEFSGTYVRQGNGPCLLDYLVEVE